MATNKNTTDDRLSVSELEQKLKKMPNDNDLKERLADALLDRYIYGEADSDPGNKSDIARVRKLLSELPRKAAPYIRAYVFYLEEKDDDAIRWLVKYFNPSGKKEEKAPITSEELYVALYLPFMGFSKGSWIK